MDAEGTVEIILSPDEHPQPSIKLEPDAVCAITRDYLVEPDTSRRMEWQIECLDGDDEPLLTDEGLAKKFRAVRTWIEDQAKITPLALGEPNIVEEPYPVPTATFGWAAGDAAYAMGSYELADDEALVIRGRSPECAFWNLCLWNPFLHIYNADYDRVTINGGQVHLRARRLVDDRRVRARSGPPELGADPGPPARAPVVPLVLPGGDSGATDGRGRRRERPR